MRQFVHVFVHVFSCFAPSSAWKAQLKLVDPKSQEKNVKLEIRTAEIQDARRLAELNREVQEMHVRHVPAVFSTPSSAEMETAFRAFLTDKSNTMLVAYYNGEIVGYLLLVRRTKPQNPFCRARDMVEMDQICVAEPHRAKGVARRLLDRAVELCREEGYGEIHLSVWGFNTGAQQAFASLGFEEYYKRMALKL